MNLVKKKNPTLFSFYSVTGDIVFCTSLVQKNQGGSKLSIIDICSGMKKE